MQQRTLPELSTLLQLPGLGAKRVQTLHDQLGITSLADLKRTERNLRYALEHLRGQEKRAKLAVAEEIATALVNYLEALEGVKNVVVAGSYRRRQATVGDLDMLVTCRRGAPVMDHFVNYEDVQRVISHGDTRSP